MAHGSPIEARPCPVLGELLDASVFDQARSDVGLLGLTSRFEFEDFLKNRSIYDQAYSVEELAEDLENLRKLRRASSDEDRWRT